MAFQLIALLLDRDASRMELCGPPHSSTLCQLRPKVPYVEALGEGEGLVERVKKRVGMFGEPALAG